MKKKFQVNNKAELIFSFTIILSLIINNLCSYPVYASTSSIPDSIQVSYSAIPSILQADVSSEAVIQNLGGVKGKIALTNPFNWYYMSISITQSQSYNMIPDPSDLDSIVWTQAGFIPPGKTLTYQSQFTDTSQSVNITGITDSKAIFVSAMMTLIGEIPEVKNSGKSKSEILKAMGDFSNISTVLQDASGIISPVKEIIQDPISFQTIPRILDLADNVRDYFASNVGANWLTSVCKNLGVQDIKAAQSFLGDAGEIYTLCKMIGDSLVSIGIYVYTHDLTSNITISAITSGPGIPPVAPRLISPVGTIDSQNPNFRWGTSLRASTYLLMISTDTNFSNVLFRQRVTTTSYQYNGNLPTNTPLYWQVIARTDYGNESPQNLATFIIGNIVYPSDPNPKPSVDNAIFTQDVTIPDGTIIPAQKTFVKTWAITNTGVSIWGTGYQFVFVSGEQMNANSPVNVSQTTRGQTRNISVSFQAPSTPGDHLSYWQLRNAQGIYFGPKVWVRINVPTTGSQISLFTVDPASPSNTSSVTFHAREDNFPNFRAMRLLVDGQEKYQLGSNEITYSWNTNGYNVGDHSITVQIADQSDSSWSHPESQSIVYTLLGTSTVVNHAPNRPLLVSPYNWYVYYSGNTASLCAQGNGDPDNDSITSYYFQVLDSNSSPVWNSGWTSSSCVTTGGLSPNLFGWKVQVKDSHGAISDWSDTWNFTIVNPSLSITQLSPVATDSSDENIKIYACTAGQGGVNVTMRIDVNTANDGSDSGTWNRVYELSVPCFKDSDNNVPVWNTLPYIDGTHLIRVQAHGLQTGWDGAAVKTTTYPLKHRRPDSPQILSPVGQNGRIFLNSKNVNFVWNPANNANSYTVYVSTNPDPTNNPLFQVPVSGSTTNLSLTFAQYYPTLYWKVSAINDAGSTDSGIISLGLDSVAPTCTVAPLNSTTYDNNFQVTWGGSDDLSGIDTYDIQYLDRNSWMDWLTNVPASKTYELFTGQPGHSYSFRCLATDSSNNVGSYPSSGNTTIKIDPLARPSELWWNIAYTNKRDISVLNNMSSMALPTGYPLHVHFDNTTAVTSTEIYTASQATPKCNDLRIVSGNTTELNRIIRNCSTDAIDIWFRSAVSVPAGSSDTTSHQIYYGNPNPGTPPADPNQVWYPYYESGTQNLYYLEEGTGTTTVDNSGYGRNCSIYPGAQWSTGKFGNGIQVFQQTQAGTRSLYCGTVPTLSTMTIEFWYKTSSDVDGRIMGALSGNNNGGGGNNWLLNYRGNIDFEVWPCSSCGSQDVHSNFNLRNAPYRGQWNYIAMTFDGGNTVNFYINGILDSTQHLNSTGLNTYAPPLEIGSSEGIGYINANIGGLKISNNIKTSFSYGSFANITNEPTTQVGSLIPPTVTGSVDLEVTGVNIDIDNYQDAIITAQVVNKGTQSTGNGFYTDLYIDHLPSGVGDLQNSIKFWVSDPIPAGGTANLTSEPICETYSSSPSCQIHLFSTASTLPQENDTYYVQTDSLGSLPTADKTNTVASEGHCFVQYDQFEYLSAQVGPPIDNSYGGASTITINPADASTLTSQTHNFAVPGDVDWAKFVAQAGQTYHIYTDNLGANTDTVLSLYDQNGTTLLAQNDDSGETIASSIDWTAPSSGTYYIKVSDWNPNTNGCNTNYNLVVQIESNPNPPTPESNQLYLPLAIR